MAARNYGYKEDNRSRRERARTYSNYERRLSPVRSRGNDRDFGVRDFGVRNYDNRNFGNRDYENRNYGNNFEYQEDKNFGIENIRTNGPGNKNGGTGKNIKNKSQNSKKSTDDTKKKNNLDKKKDQSKNEPKKKKANEPNKDEPRIIEAMILMVGEFEKIKFTDPSIMDIFMEVKDQVVKGYKLKPYLLDGKDFEDWKATYEIIKNSCEWVE